MVLFRCILISLGTALPLQNHHNEINPLVLEIIANIKKCFQYSCYYTLDFILFCGFLGELLFFVLSSQKKVFKVMTYPSLLHHTILF